MRKDKEKTMTYDKVVLITRETRLEGLVKRFNTRSQAKFYVNSSLALGEANQKHPKTKNSNADFSLFEQEHETYTYVVEKLKQQIREVYKLQVIDRAFLPNFIFSPQDIVITVGVDGLVVNTAKYLSGQPLIAVNPDPEHIDGVLTPFTVDDVMPTLAFVHEGQENYKRITMTEATLQDGQSIRACNDLFIGAATHVSARYRLGYGFPDETQSSSGIIVSTGVGATGWISSVYHMTNRILRDQQPNLYISQPKLDWEAEKLLFAVREPFVSKTTTANIVTGVITKQQPLVIESQMENNGVIFSDGIESDFLAFNAGMMATINIAEQKTNLVIKA
jgi:NAD kinase